MLTPQARAVRSGALVFVACMGVYALTLAPTVTAEDGGELIAAAYGGGVAHPPGYPLWTLLARASIMLLPLGSVAYRVNLLSAVLAASAATVLFHSLRRFFEVGSLVAGATALCFGLGRHLWSQAVIAEVYTLHILLACLVLHVALAWRESRKDRHLYLLSLLVGLGLANHHLTILLGPLLVAFVLTFEPRTFLRPGVVMGCLICLGIGLLPYLYLPLAASGDPYVNWGDPDTWEAFLRHVLRKQYGDPSMHAARTASRFLGQLGVLTSWSARQYTVAAIPFILAGAVIQARRNRDLFYIVLGLFLTHTVGLAAILNFNFQRQELFCTRVFALPAYIPLAIWMAIGCQSVGRECASWLGRSGSLRWLPLWAPAVIIVLVVATANFSANDMSHYYYAYDHANNLLNAVAPNAILLPSGDHNTFPLIYRHYVEGLRPDVIIGDKYGYVEYDLYRTMPDAPRRVRTRRQREQIEAYIIRTSGRPVYYTVKPRLDLLPEYRVVSEGMLFRVYKKGQAPLAKILPVYTYRNLQDEAGPPDLPAAIILSDYYFHLASNALRQEKPAEALRYIERAATLSEGLKEEMNNIGTLLAEFGLEEEAIRFYERAAKLGPDYLTPRWNLAHVFKARGDMVHAIQVFNDLARLDPEDYRIFGELGFLLYRYGDMSLAIKNWGKSLALNPDQPQIIEAISHLVGPEDRSDKDEAARSEAHVED